MADQLLTIPQVAAQAAVGRTTVYDWISAGLIEAIDVGTGKRRTKLRVSQRVLDRYLASRTLPAAPRHA